MLASIVELHLIGQTLRLYGGLQLDMIRIVWYQYHMTYKVLEIHFSTNQYKFYHYNVTFYCSTIKDCTNLLSPGIPYSKSE